jgi:hypothetical protein
MLITGTFEEKVEEEEDNLISSFLRLSSDEKVK